MRRGWRVSTPKADLTLGGDLKALRFRRKPDEVEAVHFVRRPDGGGDFMCEHRPQWLRDLFEDGKLWYQGGPVPYCTLYGMFKVNIGDWLVRDVFGEIQVCRGDVFAKAYEAA